MSAAARGDRAADRSGDRSGDPGANPLAGWSWARFRSTLAAQGFRPSRRLGQNFLVDARAHAAIAADAGLGPGTLVLEVGTGSGLLTRALLDRGVELLGIEIDPRLAEATRTAIAAELAGGRARIVVGDALDGKHALNPALAAALPLAPSVPARPWHLVANLPYSIASPLLALLAALERAPASMTVLVQREVGERLAARPGTADWGPLSIALQGSYGVRILRRIGPGRFWPPPDIESALLRMELRPERPSAAERAAVTGLAQELFQQRRKTLRALAAAAQSSAAPGAAGRSRPRRPAPELGSGQAAGWLERLGFAPLTRPGELSWEDLARLARAWPGPG